MKPYLLIAVLLVCGCDSKKITYKEAYSIVEMGHSAFMAGVECGNNHTVEECEKIEKEILSK